MFISLSRSSSPWGVVVHGKLAVDASEGRSGGDGNCFVAHWPCNLARDWWRGDWGGQRKQEAGTWRSRRQRLSKVH